MASIRCNLVAKAEKASTLAITLQCDWRRRLKLELMAAPNRRPGETLPASKEKENSRMRHLTRWFVVVAAALVVPPAAAENYARGRSGSTWHFRPVAPPTSSHASWRSRCPPGSAKRLWSKNQPGTGGNIAGELFARAAPDGYSPRAPPVCRALNRSGSLSSLVRFIVGAPCSERVSLFWRSITRSRWASLTADSRLSSHFEKGREP